MDFFLLMLVVVPFISVLSATGVVVAKLDGSVEAPWKQVFQVETVILGFGLASFLFAATSIQRM
jgi:hypothetical protein